MTKAKRLEVYDKYSGYCAYCGKEIEYKDMQVDHIIPKRHAFYQIDGRLCVRPDGTGVDDLDNLNPSCRRCNHYKRALDLETFRRIWLGKMHDRLAKQYVIKVALDYGIVTLKPFSGKFYFEQIKEG